MFLLQHTVGIGGQPRRIFTASEVHQLTTEAANGSVPLLLTYLSLHFSTMMSPVWSRTHLALRVLTMVVYTEVSTLECVDRGYSVHDV